MKKIVKIKATKEPLCPRCKTELHWSGDFMLHHCFQCNGWYVIDRIKNV